jgi:hypothetical protein
MLCPSCTVESSDDQLFCTHCGASLTPAMAIVAPPPPRRMIRGPLRIILCFVLLLGALLWVFFITSVQYHHQPSSEAIGYCIGLMVLPAFFAWLIAGRRSRRNGLVFCAWFFVFVVIGGFSSRIGRHHGLTDEPGPVMMQEMTGIKPLPADASEDDKQTVAATKEFFADLAQINSSYNQKQAALTPDLNKLYTAAAFADRAAIQHMQSVVHEKLALDEDTSAKIQQIPEQLSAHLQKSTLPEAQRQEFMKGVESQFNGSEIMKARREMLAAEEKWAATTNDLYDYALQHSSQIKVTNASIGIGSAEVREQFNTRFTQAKQQRDAFNASTRKLLETRQTAMKSSGLTPQDLGLTK